MKILLITSLYPRTQEDTPKDVSFAIKNLVDGLDDNELKVVSVLRPFPLVSWRKLVLNKLDHVEYINGVKIVTKSILNLPKIAFSPSLADRKFLKEILVDVDAIVSHMPLGGELASFISKSYQVPFIHVVHGTDVLKKKNLVRYTRRATAILSRSYSVEAAVKKLGLYSQGICFSGIERNLIVNEKEAVVREDQKNECLQIVSVCNLQKLKNLDVVITAMSKLPQTFTWFYTIVGAGEEKQNLENLVVSLGLQKKVKFLGYQNREVALELMRKSNVFVMPSAPETFGLAYIEAMASGCIIIGAKGWGIDGVVVDRVNGYLVTPRDIDEIIQVLLHIFNFSQDKLIKNSLLTVSDFTSEAASENYQNLLLNSLRSKIKYEK